MGLKVAIVGFAPSSRLLAPFGNSQWEIWGLNDGYHDLPRWDRWFQLHSPRIISGSVRDRNHWDWLKAQTKPIYMREALPEVPASVRYPLEDITAQFGRYFTNSISWMIALAIHEGAEDIGIYGVDMATGSEYGDQRPSCEYFLGLALGTGIRIHVPPQSELLKAGFLYGFEDEKQDAFTAKMRARLEEIGSRLDFNKAGISKLEQERHFLMGARENMQYVLRNWTP